ncbi:hypothetical protein D3C73_829530 [compost metagenome]
MRLSGQTLQACRQTIGTACRALQRAGGRTERRTLQVRVAVQRGECRRHPQCRCLCIGTQAGRGGGNVDLGQVHPRVVAPIAVLCLQQGQAVGAGVGHWCGERTVDTAVGMDQVLAAADLRHIAGNDAIDHHATGQARGAGHLQRVHAQRDDQLRIRLLAVIAFDGRGGVGVDQHHAGAVVDVADHPRRARHELQAGHRGTAGTRDADVGTDHCAAAQGQAAALDAGGAAVAVVAAQLQPAIAALDQAASAGNVVAPDRARGSRIDIDRDIAPVEAAGTVHRLADVEHAVAVDRIDARRTDVGGGAEQGLPHQIVVEVRIALPDQCSSTGDQRRGEGRAVVPQVFAGTRLREHCAAGSSQAVACGVATGIGPGGTFTRFVRIDRGGHQPAFFKIGCRQ